MHTTHERQYSSAITVNLLLLGSASFEARAYDVHAYLLLVSIGAACGTDVFAFQHLRSDRVINAYKCS